MKVIIVGGGIVGIAASILLQKSGHEVTLIEKDQKLGGLLNSFEVEQNIFLDFGSHVPRETGIEPLDEILFARLPLNKWNKYSYANVGNYFSGELNCNTQSIDIRALPANLYFESFRDLLTINSEGNVKNAEDALKSQFGETLAQKIYVPLLQKLLGDVAFHTLMPNSHLLFGYSRVVIDEQSTTEKLKEIEFLDNRIAHTKNAIGISTKANYYPTEPGIYRWVDGLIKQAEDLGVSFILSDSVYSLNEKEKVVKTLNGHSLQYDKLIWTLPKGILASSMGSAEGVNSQIFRGVNVVHLKYEGLLLTDNHYVYCNDPKMKSFRITLYDNLTGSSKNWCTVEVIGEKVSNSAEVLFEELKRMNILSMDAKLITARAIYLKNGFPIPFIQNEKNISHNDNIIILNKDANNFFMEDLLVKMYKRLAEFIEGEKVENNCNHSS